MMLAALLDVVIGGCTKIQAVLGNTPLRSLREGSYKCVAWALNGLGNEYQKWFGHSSVIWDSMYFFCDYEKKMESVEQRDRYTKLINILQAELNLTPPIVQKGVPEELDAADAKRGTQVGDDLVRTVLDVGCGTANLLRMFLEAEVAAESKLHNAETQATTSLHAGFDTIVKAGFKAKRSLQIIHYTGIDLSRSAIEVAQKNFEAMGDLCAFEVVSMQEYSPKGHPVKGNSVNAEPAFSYHDEPTSFYDIVLFNESLYYIKNVGEAGQMVLKAWRLLKNGGTLIISMSNTFHSNKIWDYMVEHPTDFLLITLDLKRKCKSKAGVVSS